MNQSKELPLGIAIVGFGGMGSQHARTVKGVTELKLMGSFDILEERQILAESMGVHAYSSFEEMLADEKVDIVLIATPNHLHKGMCIDALQAGKNVICEKPVTMCAADLEEVIAVSEKCGKIFTVHQNRRWDEDFLIAKKVYEVGTIGKIYNIESRVMGSQGVPADWRLKLEFGGGMMLDWVIHISDQMLWLFPKKISKVYCRLGYILGGECDDNVELHLYFEDGMKALLEVTTWNMETLPRWYMNGMDGTMTIRDFWFKQGSITRLKEDIKNNTKPIEAGKGITKTMAPRDANTLEMLALPRIKSDVCDFYRNVVGAITQGEELIVKPSEALRVMRLIDLARKSAELEQVLDFEK